MKFVTRRERLSLTKAAWAVLLSITLLVGGFLFFTIHPFLAVTQPGRGEVLVVEGWVPDACLTNAVDAVEKHPYGMIVSTGIPLKKGYHLAEFKTYAELGAKRLQHLGLDAIAVPASHVKKDRTYEAAVALSDWLRAEHPEIRSLDLVSEACHARRSWILFKLALGDDFEVGIISGDNPMYDESRWWKYSAGVRSVIGETVGYIYAKFLFRPEK